MNLVGFKNLRVSKFQSYQLSAARIVASNSSKLIEVFVASINSASPPTSFLNGADGLVAASTIASATS